MMWQGNPNAYAPTARRLAVSQPLRRAARLQPGERVLHDRFEILAPEGDDTADQIRARDLLTHDLVELRSLRLRGAVPDAALSLARQDIRRVAVSPHPHIVRIIDAGIMDDTLLLATDPRGTSLRDILAQRRLSLGEALTFARQIGAALIYAHTHGVTHGLVSPATIEIDADQTARLADFGARHVAEFALLPCPADRHERPGYCSPEEYDDLPAAPATDIFHFGALLWEMVIGSPPTPHALAQLDTYAQVDEDLRAIIAHCMQPFTSDRPASLNLLVPVLRAIQRDLLGEQPSGPVARIQASQQATERLGDATLTRPTMVLAAESAIADTPTVELPVTPAAPRFARSQPRFAAMADARAATDPYRASGEHRFAHSEPRAAASHFAPHASGARPMGQSGVNVSRHFWETSDDDPAETGMVRAQRFALTLAETLATEARVQGKQLLALSQTLWAGLRQWPRRRQLLLAATVGVALLGLLVITGANLARPTGAAPHANDVILHGAMTTLPARPQPYRITSPLVIGPGQTLKLAPGAELIFAPGGAIVIQGGVLVAQGTSAAPITLTSATDPAINAAADQNLPWQGIQILPAHDGKPGAATLANVTIRYAGGPSGTAIACQAGTLTIANSLETNSFGVGVNAAKACSGEIAHSTFQHNGGDAADIASPELNFHDNVIIGSAVTLP